MELPAIPNVPHLSGFSVAIEVFEINRDVHNNLLGEAGRLWRESLIAALSFQLRNADDRLVSLKLGGTPSQSDFDKVRGALEGYQA